MSISGGFRRRLAVAGVICGGMLATTASADAAPAWLAPVGLSNASQEASSPDIAFDRAGNATAVWTRSNGANLIVQAAVRPAGGSFGPPVDLSLPGRDALDPHLAVDGSGRAIAIWRRMSDSGKYVVQFAVRPPDGAFGAAQNASDAGQNANAPGIAITPDGVAFMTWALDSGLGNVAQVLVRQPNGSLGSPQSLSGTGVDVQTPYTGVRPAVNSRGDAVVTWDRFVGGPRAVEAAYRPAGASSFGAAQTVSAASGSLGAVYPSPAIDQQGNVTIVWEDCSSGMCDAIKANFRPAGSASSFLGVETIVGPTGAFAGFPRVAVDSQGTAAAIWHSTAGGNRVQVALRPLNRSFSSPETLSSATGETRFTNIAFDADDTAIATWSRSISGKYVVQGITRPKGGAFGAVSNVSEPGVNPEAAPAIGVDGQGNAVVAWQRLNGTHYVIEAAGYDAGAPRFVSTDIPAGGLVGAPLGFGATAVDVWSPVSLTWSFGDGAGASGPSVSHAYGAPGAYGVTVTATDGAGYSTSATRTIVVSNPVAPPAAPAGNPGPAANPARFRIAWSKLTLRRLTVSKLPRGWKLSVSCTGKKCPFRSMQPKSAKVRTGTFNALKALKKRTFRSGQTVTFRVTAPGYKPVVVRYSLKNGRARRS